MTSWLIPFVGCSEFDEFTFSNTMLQGNKSTGERSTGQAPYKFQYFECTGVKESGALPKTP